MIFSTEKDEINWLWLAGWGLIEVIFRKKVFFFRKNKISDNVWGFGVDGLWFATDELCLAGERDSATRSLAPPHRPDATQSFWT